MTIPNTDKLYTTLVELTTEYSAHKILSVMAKIYKTASKEPHLTSEIFKSAIESQLACETGTLHCTPWD